MPKIKLTCQQCGEVFEIYPNSIGKNRVTGEYCSRKCGNMSRRGIKQTPESIEKRRIAMTGHVTSPETRRKISEANKGRIISEEHKQKNRVAQTGRHHTKEHTQKIIKANSGKNNYNWKGGKERNMEQQRIKRREGVRTLEGKYADYHIKGALKRDFDRLGEGVKISTKDIPQELVELKRAQLKLYREVRDECKKDHVG